jgi:hypothetical protein
MSTPPPATGTTAPPPTNSPPWWQTSLFHLVTGVVVLGAGFGLLHYGQGAEGAAAIGSGLTFLGVGAGTASSS